MSKDIDLSAIPPAIPEDIRKRARTEWPDDREWQQDFVRDEALGYTVIQSIDFANAATVKDVIVAEAMGFHETWEDRAAHVKDEIEAFAEIAAIAPDDIPADALDDMKLKFAVEGNWFSIQLDHLRSAIDGYRYVRDTREKVGPIRDLLVRMEGIIGKECYNGNIQNYSSWGEWEGEGRSFRYPVTFIRNGSEDKRRASSSDLSHEELVTGYYKFGANELSIYRALVRIIDMLEAEYGFERPGGKV